MAGPFSSPSLGKTMAASLPHDASPQLKNALEVLALAAHACMLIAGFRLTGLDRDDRISEQPESAEPPSLPSGWNAADGSNSFRYAHSQSSMEFLLKVRKMGTQAVVTGTIMGDDRACNFDVSTKEYILDDKLPSTPGTGNGDSEAAVESILGLFLTPGRLSDFGNLVHSQIIQKLDQRLQKSDTGEEEDPETSLRHERARVEALRPTYDPLREEHDPPARPYPFHDPLIGRQNVQRPMPEPMPGFEDELEIQRPDRGGIRGHGGPPRIGERDLYPAGLGPNDPLRGGVGPGLGPMGGGGMHPTFDDPLFTGEGRRPEGYDPQAPPGSRYDPVGPGFGGHPRGAGMDGGPPNPFGGFGGGDFI